MLYQVKDNKITLRSVPFTYVHENGSQTVGYNLMTSEELARDGWVEVVDVKPEYNQDTHYLESKEIIEGGIPKIVYTIVEKDTTQQLIPSPSEIDEAEYDIKLTETLSELGVL